MSAGVNLPGGFGAAILEHKARRIGDPIERLRYLRKAAEARALRQAQPDATRRRTKTVFLILLVLGARIQTASDAWAAPLGNEWRTGEKLLGPPAAIAETLPSIWLVERTGGQEVFSSGLRIEDRFQVPNVPRRYQVFDPEAEEPLATDWRTEPAGIVYHTTESHQLPLEAERNQALKRVSEALLEYVRSHRCYHFVIDRFGRVFRVVAEADAANHAGRSAWADSRGLYVDLNHSFLAVSFEAQSRSGDDAGAITPAQVQAARLLTQMLRAKYRIPAGNCVTHAQVSVNPDNMRIGYHTDWAGGFPFEELALPNNYSQPLASLYAFGFGYDPSYVRSAGARLWKGLVLAEDLLRQAAASRGLSTAGHKTKLQQRFRKILALVNHRSESEEIAQ